MCTLRIKTNSSKGKDRLPSINFQVAFAVSFREGSSCETMLEARQEQETREAQEALSALEVPQLFGCNWRNFGCLSGYLVKNKQTNGIQDIYIAANFALNIRFQWWKMNEQFAPIKTN